MGTEYHYTLNAKMTFVVRHPGPRPPHKCRWCRLIAKKREVFARPVRA